MTESSVGASSIGTVGAADTAGAPGVPVPVSMSPSKIGAFTDCALAFRFSVIDRLPEPPSPHAVKGTLVHRALERLFWYHERGQRSPEVAAAELDRAWEDLLAGDELPLLGLDAEAAAEFRADARTLLGQYFELEDPDSVDAAGIEVLLETDMDGMRLRGIVDRLDIEDGEFVVVDYKTGRSPGVSHERARLAAVQTYALLCERVLGRRPAAVKLLYLRDRVSITSVPSDQSVTAVERRLGALWSAVRRACETDDFRPRPSTHCQWCSFERFCPAFGGDPSLARADGPAGTAGAGSAPPGVATVAVVEDVGGGEGDAPGQGGAPVLPLLAAPRGA